MKDTMPRTISVTQEDNLRNWASSDDAPQGLKWLLAELDAERAACAAAEQRALDVERERDEWSRRAFDGQAKRDALYADLKTLLPLARLGVMAHDFSYGEEELSPEVMMDRLCARALKLGIWGTRLVNGVYACSDSDNTIVARDILEREGV